MTTPVKHHRAQVYRIKLKGCLDPEWSDWFGQMAIRREGGVTILTGSVSDQTALHGILIRIRDLNLTLLSVERLETGPDQDPQLP